MGAESELASRYDRYWRERDTERARARSRARARLALALLNAVPPASGDGPGPRLFEVGCGPGWALEMFRDAGYEAQGADVSPRAVELARERGLEAATLDLERESISGRYNAVVALEVLEHLVDPLGALEKLKVALVPGGFLVVSLPNEFHLGRRLAILCGSSSGGGHDDPHLRYFDERRARRLFAAARLRVLRRLSESAVPPRWALLRALSAPLVGLFPGLFALAHLFLLEEEARP